uniref:RNA-directed DNA polymerase n=1 Tax=Culex tarsalis TaxID=7177 RepID=A0A1Q3EU21_CULTA
MSDPDPQLLYQEQLRQEALRQEQLRQEQQHQEQLRQEQLRQEQLRQQQLQQNPDAMIRMMGMFEQLVNSVQQTVNQQQELMQRFSTTAAQPPPNPEQIIDSLAGNIKDFRYDADSSVTFAAWYSRYDDLFAQDAARLQDDAKVRLLLRKLGLPEHDRYVSFILPRVPKDFCFADTVATLKSLFGAKESVVSRRYRCLQISKQPTEDHVSYACRVNKLCVEFDLGKLTHDEFKCLVYVCGLKSGSDAEIRTRLLSKIEENADVTLQQLSDECQRLLNLQHDNAMIETSTSNVNKIQQRFDRNKNNKRDQAPAAGKSKGKPPRPCWLCGADHYVRDCTFRKHKCADCGAFGHREGYCSSAKPRKPFKRGGRRDSVRSNVVVINECTVQKRRRFVSVDFGGTPIRLQLDTASDITVISRDLWRKVGSPRLASPSVRARTASGTGLSLDGEFRCDITIAGSTRNELIRVTEKPLQLLGSDLVDSFGLASIPMDSYCCNVSSFPDPSPALKLAFPKVFSEELGLCTKTKVKLELKENCRPTFCPKRPVAYAMVEAVDRELDRLQQLNIITPIDYSEWAAPIVVVRKANGSIRICGDYSTGLNAALQPHQYPLPLPEDIFAKLANCKVFSQIDLSDAFLQVEVDERDRHLLTINTHRGLYLYNRLAPGVKNAPGAFQQITATMLAGIPGASCYLDDVIVGGATQEEHDRNLKAVLQRIEDYGFTIRLEKCSFGKNEIRYLGHIIDSRGLRPDPAKIEAITNMPPPTDVSGVRSFLGAINYYGKFVPNMRMLRYPIDKLLKADAKFVWDSECQQAFEKFKQILTSGLLLTHYDPRQEIIVSADASSVGLGATISHKFPDGSVKVVQHASRSLTKAEQNYSQPDREGLAIVFAVTKFHKMIFGRRFLLQTDHAPLLRIFGSKKGIPVYTANRLQRFALNLLLYDFSIRYISTDKFGDADVLSRLINQHVRPEEDYVIASIRLEEDIRSVAAESINALPLSFSAVAKSTQSDPLLRKLYRYVLEGWPKAKVADPEIRRYQIRADALTVVDGCILFAERLVIPAQHRKRCLEQLHRGHPGMVRMKQIARSYVYWPSLDDDIVSYVKACQPCASVARSPPHSPPVPWPKAAGPWQRIHIDFAGPINGDYFLIAVDSFSKWPEVVRTQRISALATIAILRRMFAQLGMPTIIVSDNGTQFTSAEFAEFCASNGIHHTTTAPYHPQSNGQAERFVDTFKRAVKKISEGRGTIEEALDIFLLTYRSTPNRCAPEGKSPSEIMFGRKIRTCLELLRPPAVRDPQPSQKEDQRRSFIKQDLVYAQVHAGNAWKWAPGVILERIGSVMYNVRVGNQRVIRSHINQLRGRSEGGPADSPPSKPKALPLDVLLGAWKLASTSSVPELPPLSPMELTSRPSTPELADPAETPPCASSSPDPAETPPRASSTPRPRSLPPQASGATPSPLAASSSSSSSSTSEPTIVPQLVPALRRSDRNRRAPVRFDYYQLY